MIWNCFASKLYKSVISPVRGPYGKLWTEFFPLLLWKQGIMKKNPRGSITCRTDRANEANKMFIIWLCWLFREKDKIIWRFDKWSRARGPYCFLRTRNWPITACEISQPYKNILITKLLLYCHYIYNNNNNNNNNSLYLALNNYINTGELKTILSIRKKSAGHLKITTRGCSRQMALFWF